MRAIPLDGWRTQGIGRLAGLKTKTDRPPVGGPFNQLDLHSSWLSTRAGALLSSVAASDQRLRRRITVLAAARSTARLSSRGLKRHQNSARPAFEPHPPSQVQRAASTADAAEVPALTTDTTCFCRSPAIRPGTLPLRTTATRRPPERRPQGSSSLVVPAFEAQGPLWRSPR